MIFEHPCVIDINKLTKADHGRAVRLERGGIVSKGYLRDYNEMWVYVEFENDLPTYVAMCPHQIDFWDEVDNPEEPRKFGKVYAELPSRRSNTNCS